jgi:hypothetical protein
LLFRDQDAEPDLALPCSNITYPALPGFNTKD